MRRLSFPHVEAAERLARQIAEIVTAAKSLTDMQLLAPSRCHGWSALDLIVHVRIGLEEMAIGAARAADEPDYDAASYWVDHPDDRDDDPVPHILWMRRVATAYARPSAAVRHLEVVGRSATTVVGSMSEGTVEFQGKRMRSGDFLATWVVELAVHQLDLGIEQEEPSGLEWTRRTLEAIAEADLPLGLDDRSAVLVGLGRIPTPLGLRLAPPYPLSL
jgi:hypothetical protein